MGQGNYKTYFKKNHWGKFGIDICNKLTTESVLLTALPAAGKRYFLRHVKEYYKQITNDSETIILSFEILPNKTKILHLSHKITKLVNYELNFPKYLNDLNCEETINECIKRKRGILIIINQLERLQNSPKTLVFLESLRTIDQMKIRFLIGCDISCLVYPQKYRPAGILTSSNVKILPVFNLNQTKLSISILNEVYKWKVPQKWTSTIYRLSGGNPGLVKYIIRFIHENNPSKLVIGDLIKDLGISFKLDNIYEKLKENNLIASNKLNLDKKDLLIKLGIISKDGTVKLHLLKYLFSNIQKPKLDFRRILSTQEYQLFKFLEEQSDKLVNPDDISEALWKDQVIEKFSLWSIYKVISNLKRKLEKYGYKIKNYRGRGYTLIKSRN